MVPQQVRVDSRQILTKTKRVRVLA